MQVGNLLPGLLNTPERESGQLYRVSSLRCIFCLGRNAGSGWVPKICGAPPLPYLKHFGKSMSKFQEIFGHSTFYCTECPGFFFGFKMTLRPLPHISKRIWEEVTKMGGTLVRKIREPRKIDFKNCLFF